jgi:TRAP transporter 4TM/12TM fusion protein
VFEKVRSTTVIVLGVVLCLFTLVFANYPVLSLQSSLTLFVLLGLVICYLTFPVSPRFKDVRWLAWMDVGLAIGAAICCGYVFIQITPAFDWAWPDSAPFTRPTSLDNRAGAETAMDFAIGLVGLLLVLEATRRSIGWIVPALSLMFVGHSYYCYLSYEYGLPEMPEWMLPHMGQNVEQLASATFLQSTGVFGQAAKVMFQYVFLFVVFGSFLEMSGATQFIIAFSEKIFGRSPGGPAKISVLGSGLMGSLSGSAVANAVTTGSFTIPMMRNAGFPAHVSGGITAAAASGGALVPPVMGAGAYMMLEFIERPAGMPQVTFLEVARAALLPAVLYYLSIYFIVHFFSLRVGSHAGSNEIEKKPISVFEGVVFFGALGGLVGLLIMGFSPFKAVTGSLMLILLLSTFRPQLNLTPQVRTAAVATFAVCMFLHQMTFYLRDMAPMWIRGFLGDSWVSPETGVIEFRTTFDSLLNSSFFGMYGLIVFGLIVKGWRPEIVKALSKAAKGGVSLVAASACVGIIIGIIQTTPMANDFGAAIKSVVESNLLLALIGIMVCSLILGMGVPSVVCYLLMATLMGSLLGELGVDLLAAHLFIFYFGMMSMVTPPVALAAYASASIADAGIMRTSWAAFRFSLVGFTLPFMFVYRPELLLMGADGTMVTWGEVPQVALAFGSAVMGIVALGGTVTGYFFWGPLAIWNRILACPAAILLLMPGEYQLVLNSIGAIIFAVTVTVNFVRNRRMAPITA